MGTGSYFPGGKAARSLATTLTELFRFLISFKSLQKDTIELYTNTPIIWTMNRY